jgi:hypothetical protein
MTPPSRQLALWWRTLLILGAVYAAVAIGVAAHRAATPYDKKAGTSDYASFYRTARHFLQTGRITPDEGVRNYSPFFTVLMVPPAMLPCWLGAGLMAGISAGALVLSVAMMLRGLAPRCESPPILTVGVPVLMALPFINDCLVLGQVSILVGMLCLLSWWLVGSDRPWSAGLPLAVAVLIKPFLFTLVVFLAIKRQWKAVLATLSWGLLLGGGMTFAVMKPPLWVEAHRDYYQRVICGSTPIAQIAADKPTYARFSNQSLAMVVRRLLTDTPADDPPRVFRVNLTRISPRAARMVYLAVVLALTVVTVGVGRHPLDRIEPERAHLEFAMFLLWGLFGSPIVWTHYLPLALYPLVLLTIRLLCDANTGRPSRLCLAAWAFWIVADLSLLSEPVALPYLRAVGVHMWATVLLWLAMAASAARIRPISRRLRAPH